MATTSGRGKSCCVVLFLALTSVSAVQRLDSINDLKNINFGQSVPKHSLLLLYWFANIIEIDGNDIRLPFDPNNGDYGSHHYGNFDRVLDPQPYGQKYYTVGNLYTDTSEDLPDYVVSPRAGYEGGNRDRIIVRVQNGGRQRIDRMFITQHYGILPYTTDYDPEHTYEITANLLRQIREFSVGTNQQELSMLRNRFGSNANESQLWNLWGGLAGLGLLLFIVIQERYNFNQQYNQQNKTLRAAAQMPFADYNYHFPEMPIAKNNDYFPKMPIAQIRENRQNHGNDEFDGGCCIAVVLILLALFLLYIFIH